MADTEVLLNMLPKEQKEEIKKILKIMKSTQQECEERVEPRE